MSIFDFCNHSKWKKLMTLLEDVQAEIGEVKADIINVVKAVDLKVEALFKIIAEQGTDISASAKDALSTGIQDLKTGVLEAIAKVETDDTDEEPPVA